MMCFSSFFAIIWQKMKKNTSWKFMDELSVTFQSSVSGPGEFGLKLFHSSKIDFWPFLKLQKRDFGMQCVEFFYITCRKTCTLYTYIYIIPNYHNSVEIWAKFFSWKLEQRLQIILLANNFSNVRNSKFIRICQLFT